MLSIHEIEILKNKIMYIKLLIVAIILIAIVVIALGIKMWLDPKSEFKVHSCAMDDDAAKEDGTCITCQVNEPETCLEKEEENNKE